MSINCRTAHVLNLCGPACLETASLEWVVDALCDGVSHPAETIMSLNCPISLVDCQSSSVIGDRHVHKLFGIAVFTGFHWQTSMSKTASLGFLALFARLQVFKLYWRDRHVLNMQVRCLDKSSFAAQLGERLELHLLKMGQATVWSYNLLKRLHGVDPEGGQASCSVLAAVPYCRYGTTFGP
jgi:hypothetical protein